MNGKYSLKHRTFFQDSYRRPSGFSLLESLISMSVFCLVLLSSLETFRGTRLHFVMLQKSEESNMSAYSALDKMKKDISMAGSKLAVPLSQGWLNGMELADERLTIRRSTQVLCVGENLRAGQTWIPLDHVESYKKGQEVCIFDRGGGELKTITRVDDGGIAVMPPLNQDYQEKENFLGLIKKTAFYLDQKTNTLRRKVNASPAQPLCESVRLCHFTYDTPKNLITIELGLQADEEKTYAVKIYPKNMAAAGKQ